MEKCDKCAYAENYKAKLQALETLLGKFPPYHGASWNYDKGEVEAWLQEARSAVEKAKNSRY